MASGSINEKLGRIIMQVEKNKHNAKSFE